MGHLCLYVIWSLTMNKIEEADEMLEHFENEPTEESKEQFDEFTKEWLATFTNYTK